MTPLHSSSTTKCLQFAQPEGRPPITLGRKSSRKSQRWKATDQSSHYETPILKIVIGDEEAIFNVNEGLLQSTSFFQKERRLPQKSSKPLAENMGRASVDSEASDLSERTIHPDESVNTIDLTIDDADFVLKGRFYYTRDAFAIFVRSLNDAAPFKPQNGDDRRSLFKAYALAQQYDAEVLQNQVISALQSFYAENTIPVSDVLYLIQHWGDTVECFLAGYLVAQAAYEMASDWPKYRADNEDVVQLFGGGTKIITEQLFQAAMQYANPAEKQDPAKQKRAWRFEKL